jgi:adenylate cyclase
MTSVNDIFEWLVDGAPGATGPEEVLSRMCEDLGRAGIPIERGAAFVRTLHPHIMGRAFYYERGAPMRTVEGSFAQLSDPSFLASPVATVYRTRAKLRRRLMDPSCPRDHTVLEQLVAEGFTDYLALPLLFLGGDVHVVTIATKDPAGFTDAHIAAVERVVRPLSRVAEILGLRRTAVNLLNTYVGRDAGERILAGKIQRGDTDTIHAVIWFSDLRGFTQLAAQIAPATLISVLNELFECQVPAILAHGGEVLKFIGDGLLAIFPLEGVNKTPDEVCEEAFAAADAAFGALANMNDGRRARGEQPIRFGLALHIGEIAYGNIGGAGRLDFTCIGPAVNVASRLEGLTGGAGRPVVVSAEIAALTTRRLERLGAFELKGVSEPQEVFAPADGRLAAF